MNIISTLYYRFLRKIFFDRKKYRYKPIPALRGVLPLLPKFRITWRNGFEFRCPNDNYYWIRCTERGEHEPALEKLVKVFLKPGDVVLDVGAQIGITGIYFSKLVGDTGCVYAFEPHPENFKYLTEAIALNDTNNILTINKGVASESGKLFFWEGLPSGYTILPVDRQQWSKDVKGVVEVDCITVDSFLNEQNIQHVDLLKVDVDGNDFDVLKGARLLLSSAKPPLVVFESSTYWRAMGVDVNEAVVCLQELGFDLLVSPIKSNLVYHVTKGDRFKNGWGMERSKALNFYAVKNPDHKRRIADIFHQTRSISELPC